MDPSLFILMEGPTGLVVEHGVSTINCGSGKHNIYVKDLTDHKRVSVLDHTPKME